MRLKLHWNAPSWRVRVRITALRQLTRPEVEFHLNSLQLHCGRLREPFIHRFQPLELFSDIFSNGWKKSESPPSRLPSLGKN